MNKFKTKYCSFIIQSIFLFFLNVKYIQECIAKL